MTDTVCIVGAGPSGLVTAKKLRDAGLNVCIFESTDCIGGVWALRPPGTEFRNAMYEHLSTNLPAPLMAFEEHPFPLRTPLFPSCHDVLAYLESYVQRFSLMPHIRFCTKVEDARWDSAKKCWIVVTCDTSGQKLHHTFGMLAVCSGHYNVPLIPTLPGADNFPGGICHSYEFYSAKAYEGKSVLIVGGSASAADIAAMILKKAEGCTVHLCLRSASKRLSGPGKYLMKDALKRGALIHGRLKRLTTEGTAVLVSHPEGLEQEVRVDSVLCATGYKYEVPFLRETGLEADLCGDGSSMHHLYQRVFYTRNSTLAFLGTPNVLIPPFAVFERQAQLLGKAWSGAIQLPTADTMEEETNVREQQQLAKGNVRDDLALGTPSYCNELAGLSGTEGYWSVLLRSKLWRIGASSLIGTAASRL